MRTPSQRDYALEILFKLTPGKFDIPLDWTVEQADRFVTILSHLEEAVWILYGDDIIDRDRAERPTEQLSDNHDDADPYADDEIPF
jgi:hypothetical protein